MKNQKKTLSLLLLLAVNQSFNINAGIGDFFEEIYQTATNIKNEVERIALAADSFAIDATDAIDSKTGLNTTGLRQALTGLAYTPYMINPDANDYAVRQASVSGYLDLEKDLILEILHQIDNFQVAPMMSPATQVAESKRIFEKIHKLGAGFKKRIFGDYQAGKIPDAAFESVQSLLGKAEQEGKKTINDCYSEDEMSFVDDLIVAGILAIMIGFAILIIYITLKYCTGNSGERIENIVKFKECPPARSIYANDGDFIRALSNASIDTLA